MGDQQGIDRNFITKFLDTIKTGIIPFGSSITYSDCLFLSKISNQVLTSLIPEVNKESDIFIVQKCCPYCKETWWEDITKTNLIRTIRAIRGLKAKECHKPRDINIIICQQCKIQIKKKRELEDTKEEIYLKEKVIETTNRFINLYLNPNNKWNSSIKQTFSILSNDYIYCDQTVIKEYILKMEYSSFLQTPYWKSIAYEIKRRASFRCQLCNSKENLNSHHSTYNILGAEIPYYNRKYLICLCQNCHSKFHKG